MVEASLHTLSFTWNELRKALPQPKASLFRAFVLLNGIFLHFSGDVISLGRAVECCQTDAGMRMVLHRCGFTAESFCREGSDFLWMRGGMMELSGGRRWRLETSAPFIGASTRCSEIKILAS